MARAAFPIVAAWVACFMLVARAQHAPGQSAAAGVQQPPGPAVAEERAPDATAIARRAEAALRGETTIRAARVTLSSPKRVVRLHAWDDRRRDRSFLRLLSPAREAGTGYLRLPPNVWQYVPRLKRLARIAPVETLEPWLGGSVTLDDWLHASSEIDDYDHRLLRSEQDADGRQGVDAWVLAYEPRAGAKVVWGRIEVWVAKEGGVPLRKDYYDGAGARVRSLRFDDVREVDGRLVPHRWLLKSQAEPARETRIELESIAFDREIDDAVFSPRNLKSSGQK